MKQQKRVPGIRQPVVTTVWLLSLSVGVLLIWASTASVTQSARAPGQVIASMRTQFVQATDDGVLTEVRVQEGEKVRQGQVLARLDPVQARAAVNDSELRMTALLANVARLHAEVMDSNLVFPPEVTAIPQLVASQTQLYRRRRTALEADLRTMRRIRDATQRELSLSLKLLESGDISQVEVMRLQKSLAEVEGNISGRQNRYLQDAQAEMNKAEEELATQRAVYESRRQTLGRTELAAPTDGVVRNIRLNTVGARVRPGEVVMDLLPTDGNLIFEARVHPGDVAFVRVGSPAFIKLDAFDYTIYGSVAARVTYVSPDALTDETRTTDRVYYRVLLKADPQADEAARAGRHVEFLPGMTGQVDIQTGENRVLTYLTKPLTKTLNSAFTER